LASWRFSLSSVISRDLGERTSLHGRFKAMQRAEWEKLFSKISTAGLATLQGDASAFFIATSPP
jgi:hypothetical protein